MLDGWVFEDPVFDAAVFRAAVYGAAVYGAAVFVYAAVWDTIQENSMLKLWEQRISNQHLLFIRCGDLFEAVVYLIRRSIRCSDLFDAGIYSTMQRSIRCGGLLNKSAVFYWCWWITKLQCNEFVVVFGFRIPFGFTVFLWLIRKLRSELQYDFYCMKD